MARLADLDNYELNYQAARAQAHNLSDQVPEQDYVVVKSSVEDEFDVLPKIEKMTSADGRHVLYTARPGTVTYMYYVAECESLNYVPLSKDEWTKKGCVSFKTLFAKENNNAAPAKRKANGQVVSSTPRVPREPGAPPTKGATKQVWDIADKVTGSGEISRSAVVAACIEAGINKGTAAVQYAAWKKARLAGEAK